MTREYLTPEEAEAVKLPIVNLLARRRLISQYAGQLTAGQESLRDRKPKTRRGLVWLAHSRRVLDSFETTKAKHAETIGTMMENIQKLKESNDELSNDLRGVSNNPAQLELDGVASVNEQLRIGEE